MQLIIEINNLRREIDYLKRERQQQRLHVSKLKSNNTSKSSSGKPDDISTLNREIETNKTTIDDLRRRVEEQTALRSTAAPAVEVQ